MNKKHFLTWKKSLIALSRFGLAALFYISSLMPSAEAKLKNLSDVIMMDGGVSYGLALKSDGTVLAWGSNDGGQLGNGTTDSSLLPVQASGLGSGSDVIAISAGNLHALALKSDGTVLAWGTNILGQLGDGTIIPKLTPVQVTGLGSGSGVIAISAGFNHSLALKSDGTVLCWGRNQIGACGDGTTTNRLTPVQVTGDATGIVAISAGANFSMALKSDGTVMAWGNNNNGQLGIGSSSNLPTVTPVQVKGVGGVGILTDVIAISNASINGATFAMALKSDGTVLAWGLNGNGQLGDGSIINRLTPVQVSGLGPDSGISAIVAGGRHAMALKSDGTVLAWGLNSNGQLGDGTTTQSSIPVQVSDLVSRSGVTAIATGDLHSYVLKCDGTVLAWGNNSSGQLGDGTFFGQALPVQTSGLGIDSDVIQISAGFSHSLALKSDGTVLAWGDNTNGRLGDGTISPRLTPVQVKGVDGIGFLSGVTAISADTAHNLALKSDGTVLAWGLNSNGQLGDGTIFESLTPVQVKDVGGIDLTDVIEIAAADSFSLALKSDGTVVAWGFNPVGQLGDDTTTQSLTPVQVKGIGGIGFLSGVVAISAGSSSSYALKFDGTVLAWGLNALGQLGDDTTANKLTPVQVSNLGSGSGVIAISAGHSHCLALKSDGTALAWGRNDSGQLGDGATTQRLTPVQVTGLGIGSGVTAVRGGFLHTLALKSDGTVLAWGANSNGQLGDGTTAHRLTPVQTSGLGSGSEVEMVAAGSSHSLALQSDGTVLAWGANANGQLGDGTVYTKNLTPSNVLFDKKNDDDDDSDRDSDGDTDGCHDDNDDDSDDGKKRGHGDDI